MTPIEKYINELMRSRDLAVSRFSDIGGMEKKIINGSLSWMLDNLDVKGGTFVVTPDLNKQMNGFVNEVMGLITKSKTYKDQLSNYLSDLGTIGKHIQEFQTDVNKIDWKRAQVSDVQKGVISVTVDALTDNGLNQHFAQPLKDLVQSNVAAGMNQKQAKEYLQDFIASGEDKSGKLKSYLHNTAQQAVQLYEGAISVKLLQEFEFTGFIFSGSLIETSSAQCKKAVEMSDRGYLTNDQMQEVLDFARTLKNNGGLIPGTTLDNLPIFLMHHGCRHAITPTIRE